MEKLKLTKFKAFEEELVLTFNRNLLLYGENGAGKSSLYEAIKVIFFNSQIEAGLVAQTPEDLQQIKNELWSSYNNKITNQEFDIEINGLSYKNFDVTNFQVFMISLEELIVADKLNLKTLLDGFFLSLPDVLTLCTAHFKTIQDEVNATLRSFNEHVQIEIDEEDDFAVKIVDNKKNIETKSEIKRYFNEAKINVIVLLIILQSVHLAKDDQKKKVLVLDDIITSLDSSNRTFLVRHILDKFDDSQILIFTHNISFYNLVMYIVHNIATISTGWGFANLYEINNQHKVYIKSEIERAKKIKDDFLGLATPHAVGDIEAIGNRIRKKFEILLYEYSKLVMIGTVEDSSKILDRIMIGKPAYYKTGSTASDLIDVLQQILSEGNPVNLDARLQSVIESYKNHDFANFQSIVKELKLYQKVTMHPMSHGVMGMSTFTTKEIEKSIQLLEKMELFLKEMVDTNVATV